MLTCDPMLFQFSLGMSSINSNVKSREKLIDHLVGLVHNKIQAYKLYFLALVLIEKKLGLS